MSDTSDRFDPDQAEERLDRLGDDIRQTRNEVEAHGTADVAADDDDEQKFVDSGTVGEEYDDQTIAPPG